MDEYEGRVADLLYRIEKLEVKCFILMIMVGTHDLVLVNISIIL